MRSSVATFLCSFALLAFSALTAGGCSDSETTTDDPTTSAGGGGMLNPTVTTSSTGGSGAMMPDTTAPDAVTALTATANDSYGIDVSWTNPSDADLAGVLVVRRAGGATGFIPEDGEFYTTSSDLGSTSVVNFASAGTSFTFDEAVPGEEYHWSAWAYDNARNYSEIATASAVQQDFPPQTATLVVDVATPAVTVMNPPPHVTLSGTAAYNDVSDTLTVTLDVQNDTARLLFNTKVVIDSVGQGAVAGPMLGGKPYVYYGPEALDVAATDTEDIVITGVDGTVDPVTVNVTIMSDPMLLIGHEYTEYGRGALAMVDTGTYSEVGIWPCDGNVNTVAGAEGPANNNGNCSFRGGAWSEDGKWVYVGHRSLGMVRRLDTTSLSTVNTLMVGGGDTYAAVNAVRWGPDGETLYAVVTRGSHSATAYDKTGAVVIQVVRIDSSTFMEIDRLTINGGLATDGGERGRDIAFSPDGTKAAVPLKGHGEIALIDLSTFTVIDTDTATGGTQNIGGLTDNNVNRALFSSDSSTIFVSYNIDFPALSDHYDAVNLSTYAVTPVTTTSNEGHAGWMRLDNQGRLWVGRHYSNAPGAPGDDFGSALSVFNASGGAETKVVIDPDNADSADSIVFTPDGSHAYIVSKQPSVALIDVENLVRVDLDGNAGNGITNMGLTFTPGQHLVLLTP